MIPLWSDESLFKGPLFYEPLTDVERIQESVDENVYFSTSQLHKSYESQLNFILSLIDR